MAGETRDQIKRRLILQGDWDSYIKQREQYVKSGCTLKEAQQRAIGKYPPKTTFEEVQKRAISLSQFKGKPKSDLRTDFLFVYNYLDVLDATPELSPSPGAWSILCRCRSDPDFLTDFMRHIWKLLPSREELDREREFDDDGESIQQLIRQVRESSRDD